jgi:hypothetical protein
MGKTHLPWDYWERCHQWDDERKLMAQPVDDCPILSLLLCRHLSLGGQSYLVRRFSTSPTDGELLVEFQDGTRYRLGTVFSQPQPVHPQDETRLIRLLCGRLSAQDNWQDLESALLSALLILEETGFHAWRRARGWPLKDCLYLSLAAAWWQQPSATSKSLGLENRLIKRIPSLSQAGLIHVEPTTPRQYRLTQKGIEWIWLTLWPALRRGDDLPTVPQFQNGGFVQTWKPRRPRRKPTPAALVAQQ